MKMGFHEKHVIIQCEDSVRNRVVNNQIEEAKCGRVWQLQNSKGLKNVSNKGSKMAGRLSVSASYMTSKYRYVHTILANSAKLPLHCSSKTGDVSAPV